jgi:hypothetical protein
VPFLVGHDHIEHLFGSIPFLDLFLSPLSSPPTTVLAMLRVKEVINVINVISGRRRERALTYALVRQSLIRPSSVVAR